MSKHNIKKLPFVICPYCNIDKKNKFKMLHWKHLKTHNKKLEDVLIEFPNHPTMTNEYYLMTKEIAKIGAKSSSKTSNELREINCIYCNQIIIVRKNESIKQSCANCLNQGLENPDGKTKSQANQKRIETLQKKYGKNITNIAHIPGVKEKKLYTNQINNNGTGFKSNKSSSLAKKTIKNLYGEENIMKTKYGKQFFIGDKNPMKNPNISCKVSKSLIGRESKLKGRDYNDIHGNIKSNLLKEQKKKIFIKQFLNRFKKEQEYLKLTYIDNQEYQGSHILYSFQCNVCNKIFKKDWNSIQQGYLCSSCFPRNIEISKGEKEIFDFIKVVCNYKIIENSKKIIYPKELDIYIPELKVAIEYNGLYWHSEKRIKDKNYHLNKTTICKEKGIQLIHIFEDEWIFKKDIVKSRLRNILNIKCSKRIHGRDCIIKEIEPKIKNEFLNLYHIQGKDNSSIKLGAFYQDELVSVMTFSKGNPAKGSKFKEGIWELNRFCSKFNLNIPGIASKLLEHFKRNYNWIEIFSYADRRWSIGNVYNKLGFELSHNTEPNYWYIKGLTRIHRFTLRKRKDEPKDISEKILRVKEGYCIIWDCGNIKFKLLNSHY